MLSDPPPRNGRRTIKQTPLGESISIRLRRLITAPGGINIRSMVPGSGPHCGRGGKSQRGGSPVGLVVSKGCLKFGNITVAPLFKICWTLKRFYKIRKEEENFRFALSYAKLSDLLTTLYSQTFYDIRSFRITLWIYVDQTLFKSNCSQLNNTGNCHSVTNFLDKWFWTLYDTNNWISGNEWFLSGERNWKGKSVEADAVPATVRVSWFTYCHWSIREDVS